MFLRDAKQHCSCLELFFVGEIEQKQAIWCLKHKSLNINLLFIELLYKINITFVIMHTSCDLNHIKLYIYIYTSSRNVRVHSVGVLFGFCKILDNVKLHIVKTTITILSQMIYNRTPLQGRDHFCMLCQAQLALCLTEDILYLSSSSFSVNAVLNTFILSIRGLQSCFMSSSTLCEDKVISRKVMSIGNKRRQQVYSFQLNCAWLTLLRTVKSACTRPLLHISYGEMVFSSLRTTIKFSRAVFMRSRHVFSPSMHWWNKKQTLTHCYCLFDPN